jgi:hypothetical protein
MKTKSAFNEAKPLTAKAGVKARERELMDKMEEMLDLRDERDFKEALTEFLELTPGEPHYEEALSVWRSLQKRPSHPRKPQTPLL